MTLSQTTANAESLFGKILDNAISSSASEGRNNAGFWLACQLRDDGFTQAEAESAAETYACRVGDGTYSRREAISSVRSAYRRSPREPSGGNGRNSLRPRPAQAPQHSQEQRRPAESDGLRTDPVITLWHKTVPLPATPGERYLGARGLFAENIEHAVRWHPSCRFGIEQHRCVVALMCDPVTNEPTGIHRTAVSSTGQKIGRRMLGKAGVVKLSPDEDVLEGLGIAEGIETTLSVMQTGWRPMWAALSAGAIRRFPVPDGIEVLTVWSDHDAAGLGAARACAKRWSAVGKEVIIRRPSESGRDFNDIVREVAE